MPNEAAKGWIPAACTLPTVQQPWRLAEFDDFFRRAVQRSKRSSTTRLDLLILPEQEAIA